MRTDTEQGGSIAYLDNATIINACSILSDPMKFDVYKLMNLESFCEAFLFYDSIRTLVGSSFAAGYRGANPRRDSSNLKEPTKITSDPLERPDSTNFNNCGELYSY